jgi:hypothetical protein
MAEQIIDIREIIEKMRIKFEDDQINDVNNDSNFENNSAFEKEKINRKIQNEPDNQKKEEIISSKNNDLPKSETLPQTTKDFPSVQLSVKNPISSKILVFLMLLQVFSNVGIFMLLLNVLE